MDTLALTRIGRYDIVGLIGEGGMGRVYRARDTQLDRTVAIKVLSPIVALDPDRLRRFEQESRAAAALSHPGVLAIYDVGSFEGTPYLVSELLEGTSLGERLKTERLSIAKCVEYALQIVDALAAAHDKGIIHRDLKPDNVFVTSQDHIKILDFGLAKLIAPEPDRTVIADLTAIGTSPNTILGTPGYMSPEQSRGQLADHRTDIFSFGCILYEMLAGRKAFAGDTVADILSASLKEAPSPLTTTIERPVLPALDAIVQRCLAKEPASRFQSASDLGFALRSTQIGSDVGQSPVGTRPKLRRWVRRTSVATAAALAAAALLGAAIGWMARGRPAAAPVTSAEFLVPTPSAQHAFAPMPLAGLLPTTPQIGLSPDGQQLAFISTDAAGVRRLWIRTLANSTPRMLEGTDGATSWPFWSPDSRTVVVAMRRALFKVDTVSGTIERLCAVPDQAPTVPFVTGSWHQDGTVLFSIGGPAGLYRVAATGGPPEPATSLDAARRDEYHSWPQFLPDGRFLLFVRTNDPRTTGMYAGALGSPRIDLVMANATRAVYAAGYLLWSLENRLVAQPFDPAGLRLSGQSATVVPSIFEGAGRTSGFWASDTGVIAYAVGETRERQFNWFDRTGQSRGTVGPPGLYVTFDLSADLSRVVTEITKEGSAFSTLAMFDIARGVLTPLTRGDQHDSDPRFGPGGDVTFARNAQQGSGVLRMNPASQEPSVLFPRGSRPVVWLEDWASDGNSVVFRSGADRDAWQLLAGTSEPRRLTDAREPIEQVQLSPDNKLITYNTAESGRQEVFIAPVPFTGERWQVSVEGGVQPTWRSDGRELYYLGLDGVLYAVDVGRSPSAPHVGRPARLFTTSLPVISAVVEQYRPSGDGQKFLFCLPLTSVQREPLRVLLHWQERLRRHG
jgi:eukaryotic-like serine/threonine-protein kinase